MIIISFCARVPSREDGALFAARVPSREDGALFAARVPSREDGALFASLKRAYLGDRNFTYFCSVPQIFKKDSIASLF